MKLPLTLIALLALLLLAGCGSDGPRKTPPPRPIGGTGSIDAPAPPVGLNLPAVPASSGQDQGQHG